VHQHLLRTEVSILIDWYTRNRMHKPIKIVSYLDWRPVGHDAALCCRQAGSHWEQRVSCVSTLTETTVLPKHRPTIYRTAQLHDFWNLTTSLHRRSKRKFHMALTTKILKWRERNYSESLEFKLCSSSGIPRGKTFRALFLFPASGEEWETPAMLLPLHATKLKGCITTKKIKEIPCVQTVEQLTLIVSIGPYREGDPTLWTEGGNRSSFQNVLVFRTPDDGQAQQPSNPEYYAPSSEPFRRDLNYCCELFLDSVRTSARTEWR
jgi:hypothetical protein